MIKRFLIYYVLLIIPSIAFYYSTKHALKTLWIIYSINFNQICNLQQPTSDIIILKKNIHKYFLNKRLYIPLEDIIIKTLYMDSDLQIMLEKTCGSKLIYIRIPFYIKIPFWGNWIIEKCYNFNCNEQ